MKRCIVILHDHDEMIENVHKLVKTFMDNSCAQQIFVATKDQKPEFNNFNETQPCQNLQWPEECDNIPKIRNWINVFFKKQSFTGMLHVIEDTTCINKNPNEFICDIENAMNVLNYDVWFSTVCDRCNYVYSKYNPRLRITLDKPEFTKLNLGNSILFTSHSNTQWIIYNFNTISSELLRFNDTFTVAMFYIIEYLARRRNTKSAGDLYYMNQYLTVESEYGVYTTLSTTVQPDDQNILKTEDTLFRSMNIDIHPDNNIDEVLEELYKKLLQKI